MLGIQKKSKNGKIYTHTTGEIERCIDPCSMHESLIVCHAFFLCNQSLSA
jgi:hypothetical protein